MKLWRRVTYVGSRLLVGVLVGVPLLVVLAACAIGFAELDQALPDPPVWLGYVVLGVAATFGAFTFGDFLLGDDEP